MTTEKLKELGLNEEQIKAVFAEHGKVVEENKEKLKASEKKLEDANSKIKGYETKITDLEAKSDDTDSTKKELEDLKKKIADDKAEAERLAKEAREEEGYKARFGSVLGEGKWRDELTEKAVYSEFKQAVSDVENRGRGDKELFEALVKDKNYFENPNKPADMGSVSTKDFTSITKEQFSKMGYKERVELARDNRSLYDTLKNG